MTRRSVLVTAPSRLHFGMFSFGQPGERQFGGVGAMIDRPGLHLRIAEAPNFETVGSLAERARDVALQVFDRLDLADPPRCRIELLQAPTEHVGLGAGTQLALSIAAGLNAYLGNAPLEPAALARLAGRGERSAIGTYGFVHGGLLVEAGKRPGELLSPLVALVPLPSAWRFVLVIPRVEQGVHGLDERQAFGELPPVPVETTTELRQLAADLLVPAADSEQFDEFSAALFRYGHAAGLCFARFQHGAFATERLHRLVAKLRQMGIQGVGQSSWGPTVFALTANETTAENLVQSLRGLPEAEGCDLVATAPDNRGARIEME